MSEIKLSRKEQKEKTRRDIIMAAGTILMQEGPKALTTRAVAKLAGVGKGTIYTHFQSMDALIEEIIVHSNHHFIQTLTSRTYDSLIDFLTILGLMVIDAVEQQMNAGMKSFSLMDEIHQKPALLLMMRKKNSEYIDLIKEKINHITDNSLEQHKVEEVTLSLMTQIAGLKSYLFMFEDFDPMRHMWRSTAKILTTYLEGRK